MAARYLTDIRFTDRKPSGDELIKLNAAAQAIDYDFPKITEYGVYKASWRGPLLSVEQIMALLHQAGFPCEGWNEVDYGDDDFFDTYPRTPKASDPTTPIRENDMAWWNEIMKPQEQDNGN